MINEKDIRPIPKYILNKIRRLDELKRQGYENYTTYYSYLSKIRGDLVKIVVACKMRDHQWFCKQIVVHAVHSDKCLVRDIEYSLFGYTVGWRNQGLPNFSKRKYDDGKWYDAEDKYYNVLCPILNKNYVLKFKQYKYSVADKYKFLDLINYLRIYEEYPQAEYLMKLDLQQFATNKAILKQIGKDNNFRKWIIQNKEILQNKYGLESYISSRILLNAYKKDISIREEQILDIRTKELLKDYLYTNNISKIIPKKELPEFIEYLHTQQTGTASYSDYLRACETLGLDMSLKQNKYPKNFKKWHDIRIDQYNTFKTIEDEKQRKQLYQQFSEVAQKYLSLQRNQNEDYVTLIAKSPADLIKEGNTLNHCVGRMNYDQKFAREESLIFFVRNKDNPQIPFVTIEYSLQNKKILQCYAEHNSTPKQEVLDYINKTWLPYANKKVRKLVV